MTWPHSNVLSLSQVSPRNAAASHSPSPVPCLPACCQHRKPAQALNTVAANHSHSHSLRHRHHHHHHNTTHHNTTHHSAILGTIPRANKQLRARAQLRTVSAARLPPRPLSPDRRRPGTLNHVARTPATTHTKDSARESKRKLPGISPCERQPLRSALL